MRARAVLSALIAASALALVGCVTPDHQTPTLGFVTYQDSIYVYVPLCSGEHMNEVVLYHDPTQSKEEGNLWQASGAHGLARDGLFAIGSPEQFTNTQKPLASIPEYFIVEVSTNKRNFGGGVPKSSIRSSESEPARSPSQALTTSAGTKTFGQIQETAGCGRGS